MNIESEKRPAIDAERYSMDSALVTANEDLKLAINNLIWMYGPDTLTLNKAEEIALKIYGMVLKGKEV
jgi:hypothetical protein